MREPTKRVTYEYLKADIKAVKEASFVQQQLMEDEPETDSDEENLDENEELKKKLAEAGLATAVKNGA